MARRQHKHRYLVTEVGEGVTSVTVGTRLILGWYGKRHDLMVERNGEVSYLCTIVHVEKVEGGDE